MRHGCAIRGRDLSVLSGRRDSEESAVDDVTLGVLSSGTYLVCNGHHGVLAFGDWGLGLSGLWFFPGRR